MLSANMISGLPPGTDKHGEGLTESIVKLTGTKTARKASVRVADLGITVYTASHLLPGFSSITGVRSNYI